MLPKQFILMIYGDKAEYSRQRTASPSFLRSKNMKNCRLFIIECEFQEPNVGDGGAYKCTASNQFGESNANINLNFAGIVIFQLH